MLQKTFHFVLPAVTMCCNVPFPGGRDVTSLMYEANVQSSVLRYWCLPSTMCGTFLVLHITKIPIEHYQKLVVVEMVIGVVMDEDVEEVEDDTGSKVAGLDQFCLFYIWRRTEGLCFDIFTWSWLARWWLSEGNIQRDSSSGSVFIAQLDIFMIHSWIKLFHQWS